MCVWLQIWLDIGTKPFSVIGFQSSPSLGSPLLHLDFLTISGLRASTPLRTTAEKERLILRGAP